MFVYVHQPYACKMLKVFIMSLCVCICVHAFSHMCEGWRTTYGNLSSPSTCGLQDQIQAARLGNKHLYLLSHLTDCRYLIAVNFIFNS